MSIRESEQQTQNLMDSWFHYKFQNKTSSFQVQSQQNDEPIDYEKLLIGFPPPQTNFFGHHQTMVIREIRYIYDGFLVWVILSMYRSCIVIHLIFFLRMWQGWFADKEDLSCDLKFKYIWSIWGDSGCIGLSNGDVRIKVYLWGFSFLDYPLDVLVFWIHNQVHITCSAHTCIECLFHLFQCMIACAS